MGIQSKYTKWKIFMNIYDTNCNIVNNNIVFAYSKIPKPTQSTINLGL